MYKKFAWSGVILAIVLIAGTIGYWFIGNKAYSFIDTLYMTIITISTIGYGEIVDLTGNAAGRIFTVFIAISGIGVLAYVISNITALVVEGEVTKSFRRKRMEKLAKNSKDHYIVCGLGDFGIHIINELRSTRRAHVLVELNRAVIERYSETWHGEIFIEGDASDNDVLLKAGIQSAKGLFAVTDDDNLNLVISLTAKQLNPHIRVVAQCKEIKNSEKMKTAGADNVVSTSYISGMRMVSEMVRPTVVTFLDIMMRDKNKNLRVEEITVSDSFTGQELSALDMKRFPDTLLMAIKDQDDWVYNPRTDYVINHGSTLIVMTTPEENHKMQKVFGST